MPIGTTQEALWELLLFFWSDNSGAAVSIRVVKTREARRLRRAISQVLRKQGYFIDQKALKLPENPTKDFSRNLNKLAVRHKIDQAEHTLRRHEGRLLSYIAKGSGLVTGDE